MRLSTRLLLALFALSPLAARADDTPLFGIRVVDEATGRGVPLVELKTTNNVRYYTDSQGWAAVADPEWQGQQVFFEVRSHGYEFPKDGFGIPGRNFWIEAGKTAELKIKRLNVAERLYRSTGAGIERDTILLGRETTSPRPLLAAGVVGCDSILTARYRGQMYWFWGDTTPARYPLGNFHMTGATTPDDPTAFDVERGIPFRYFENGEGFVKGMAPVPGEGPTWLGGLAVVEGRLYAGYSKIRNGLETYERGIVVWNDDKEVFEKEKTVPLDSAIAPMSQLHTNDWSDRGLGDYVYFCAPFPTARVRSTAADYLDPTRYEGYTCLKAGTRAKDNQLDRDADGRLVYAWKRDTPPLSHGDLRRLIEKKLIRPAEAATALWDVETGRLVYAHNGSVNWNPYQQRYVLVATEIGGQSSHLGEIWYAESPSPTGPWAYARRIITHQRYSFYNPKHHPEFDREDGRVLYIEGTYTNSFSGNPEQTPRYDYNQLIYKLDLDDPRMRLPTPVVRAGDGYRPIKSDDGPTADVACYLADRPAEGRTAVYQFADERGRTRLAYGDETRPESAAVVGFLAGRDDRPESLVEIRRWRTEEGHDRLGPESDVPAAAKSESRVVGKAWKDPHRDER